MTGSGFARRLAGGLAAGVLIAAAASAADIFAQLQIPERSAKEAAAAIITNGVSNPGLPSAAFKLLPPAARAQLATAGVAWLKTYTTSAEFKAHYDRIREMHKPPAPQFDGTPEEELQREDAERKQQAEASKEALARLPEEQRRAVQEALAATAAALARLETPAARASRVAEIRALRAERTREYEQGLANWQRAYPDNPAPAIARRLREFLAICADVDFTAALTTTEDGSRTRFANPAYEAKSGPWKLCFRAGPEATTAARAAVTGWVSALTAAR